MVSEHGPRVNGRSRFPRCPHCGGKLELWEGKTYCPDCISWVHVLNADGFSLIVPLPTDDEFADMMATSPDDPIIVRESLEESEDDRDILPF